MQIIGALGGGGSSFVLRAIDRCNYRPLPGGLDPYPYKRHLERYPALMLAFRTLLRGVGRYRPQYRVLKRPDSFWTDWAYHASGTYAPDAPTFAEDLRRFRDYLVRTRQTRSDNLPIRPGDLQCATHIELVRSYLARLTDLEERLAGQIVLMAGHWAEYGLLADLDVPTIYVVRDPFNALVSHSKDIRHGDDYRRRGLSELNSPDWIDAYLRGPHHDWVGFAEAALRHRSATIVRYHALDQEWPRQTGLPDITPRFNNRENDIRSILTPESIDRVYGQTRHVLGPLGLEDVCRRYVTS
jgi:hypothetical protein